MMPGDLASLFMMSQANPQNALYAKDYATGEPNGIGRSSPVRGQRMKRAARVAQSRAAPVVRLQGQLHH